MNIFYFSRNPAECARQTCDKHVIKGIMDLAFMISNALARHGYSSTFLYKDTKVSNPAYIWVKRTYGNFVWSVRLLEELCKEYTVRYDKVHAVERRITDNLTPDFMYLVRNSFNLTRVDNSNYLNRGVSSLIGLNYFFAPPRIMPKSVRCNNTHRVSDTLTEIHEEEHITLHSHLAILSYRQYYRKRKAGIVKWKTGEPVWWRTGNDNDLNNTIDYIKRTMYGTTLTNSQRTTARLEPGFRGYEVERPIRPNTIWDPSATIQWP